METVKDTTKMDWVIFLISLAGMIALLAYADEWFWLALPFVLTYFVKALKFMSYSTYILYPFFLIF